MEFRALGPVEVITAGRLVDLGPARQRTVLAALLMDAGRAVPVDVIVDRVWDRAPPAEVRNVLYSYVTRIRRTLDHTSDMDGDACALVRQAGGYRLDVDPKHVDVHRFRRLIERSRAADGDRNRADLLDQALGLWRGPPLGGLSGSWVSRVREGLEQQWLGALVQWAEAYLRLGGPAPAAVDRLQAALAERPLAEPLVAQLMWAMYLDGRRAEALDCYTQARRRLVEELGLEPGPELRGVHQAILRTAAPVIGPRHHSGQPRQLPAALTTFTGREAEVARLETMLSDDAPGVAIVAISGPGGVGKSALAVHCAHRIADRFPDGQIYADLQGATPGLDPLAPQVVLDRVLRSLGDTDPRPLSVDEATARFRTLTAARALLLVLDNAREADQIRPLIPAGRGCVVLVTSRPPLVGLDGAYHLPVSPFAPEESLALFGRLVGTARLDDDPPAASMVVELCGHLPLALRIAGARLAARPAWTVRALADRLADAQRRLDELQTGDVGVRTSVAVGHQTLAAGADVTDRAAAEAYPLLGLPDWSELSLPATAAMLGRELTHVEAMLERLVDAQLLASPAPGRYRRHDLLRLFARELAVDNLSEEERTAALVRALRWYAAAAWQAARLVKPGDQRAERLGASWDMPQGFTPTTLADALQWLEAERVSLVVAVEQAADSPGVPADLAISLAQAIGPFLDSHSYYADGLSVVHTARRVAERINDDTAGAYAHRDLGATYWRLGDHDAALVHLQQALAAFEGLDDRPGQALCLKNIGAVHWRQHRHGEALIYAQRSLALRRQIGDRHGEAVSLTLLGNVDTDRRRFRRALEWYEQAMVIFRDLGDRTNEGNVLTNTGITLDHLGRHTEATAHQQRALSIFDELGDRDGQAETLNNLGVAYLHMDRHDEAITCHRRALDLFRDIGDAQGEAESLQHITDVRQAAGRPQETQG